jgi:uncharacterized protein YjbI with pentapeptide repeats
MTQTPSSESIHWQEIKAIWEDNRWLFSVVGWLLGLLTFPMLQQISGDFTGFLNRLVPEIATVTFTVLMMDRLYQARTREELKKRLLHEAGSRSIATAAVRRIRTENWLTGWHWDKKTLIKDKTTLLKGADLVWADLQGADLLNANMEKAHLRGANLQDADLMGADLEKANLFMANLQRANLEDANLQEAVVNDANLEEALMESVNFQSADLSHSNLSNTDLYDARLQNAKLEGANLRGANLVGAKLQNANLCDANLKGALLSHAQLQGADLKGAQFDEKTSLPDSEEIDFQEERPYSIMDKYWTPEVDMSRYTDPNHPNFWTGKFWSSDE